MNSEQEKRGMILKELKSNQRIVANGEYAKAMLEEIFDAWWCEPVWRRQVNVWRTLAIVLCIVILLFFK
jgi:hypothetical protein